MMSWPAVGETLMSIRPLPHLRFDKGSGVQPIPTKNLYILSGNEANSVCYIGAHGGRVGHDNFKVPANTTVRFVAPSGYSMRMEMSFLRQNQPVVTNTRPKMSGLNWGATTFGPGSYCINYHLAKWHGRHSGYTSKQKWENAGEDYKGWQRIVEFNSNLTLAFPRNRWRGNGVLLSDLITTVQSKLPNITTFWCLFCRYDGTSDWSWDAQNGCWLLEEVDQNNIKHNYYFDPTDPTADNNGRVSY